MQTDNYVSGLLYKSIYHLLNFEKYGSFQTAAREAAVSNNFQLVLFTSDFNVAFSVETRHNVSIDDAVRMWLEQSHDKEAKSARVDVEGVTTYWGPVRINDEKFYLMLVDNEKKYSQDEIIKLAEIIELAMGMWNYSPERNLAAEFIRALRRGNRELAHTLLGELGIKDEECTGVFLAQNVERDAGLSAAALFETETALRTVKAVEGGEFVGILVGKNGASVENRRVLEKKFMEHGASRIFCLSTRLGIEGMCSAFRLINETEAFAGIVFPRLKSFGRFELTLISSCVNMCINNDGAKKNFKELLLPFEAVGLQKRRQLINTVTVYMLDAGLSANTTASMLGVHINTVQYRLKRVKDLLCVDDLNAAVEAGLFTALAIARLENEVKSF